MPVLFSPFTYYKTDIDFLITNNFNVEVRGVKNETKVALKIGNEEILLDVDRSTEFYKLLDVVNTEFYGRLKYQYNDP